MPDMVDEKSQAANAKLTTANRETSLKMTYLTIITFAYRHQFELVISI
jgi:hypothetical protein